jgi:hypothetical protein
MLRWSLRPGPTGIRRLAASYLAVAAGTLAALVIVGITVLVSRHCQVGAGGFGCLSWYFRGLGLAVLGGLAVILTVSIVVKLRLRFFLSLLAIVAPALLVARVLQLTGLDVTPYAVVALAGAPALASWLSGRQVLPDPVVPSPGPSASDR